MGSVRNRGFEISVGGVLIDKKDFTWNATVNFSSNQSKVMSLGAETQMLEGRPVGSASGSENVLIKKGYPLGLFYGLQMEGIRSNWHSDYNGIGSADSPWWYATEREMPYGFPSFADTNGDGKVDMSDQCRDRRCESGIYRWLEHPFALEIHSTGYGRSAGHTEMI